MAKKSTQTKVTDIVDTRGDNSTFFNTDMKIPNYNFSTEHSRV